MQILLFVITMLLLLSAITYAKMDSYKSIVLFRKRFEVYSETRNNQFEKKYYQAAYDDWTMSTNNKTNATPTPKAEGVAYISLAPLSTDKEGSRDFSKKILKDLIPILYENKTFYQDLIKTRPQLADEVVEALDKALQAKGSKIKKVEDIANLELGDPVIAEAFYKMLKGFTLPKEAAKESEGTGYPSLMCYLTLKGNGVIRAFLAPKPILEVIFKDPQTVEEVMQRRYEIYKSYDSTDKEGNKEKNLFKEAFSNSLKPGIPPEKVDFSISGTNPNRPCVRFTN